MLAHAGRAEIVAEAAHGDDQRVVAEGALRRHLLAFVVEVGRHMHLAPLPVEPDHLADAVAEMMPVRLGEVVDRMRAHVDAAGRDLVQQRLPDMRARASISVTSALPRLPSVSPSLVASSRPPAPPPTTTMR